MSTPPALAWLFHTCSEPLFTYGVQGLEDVRQNLSSEAVKQIALDIVVNTGYVSNLTNQNDYYYNSSVAHAFYNATCSIPREGTYLHGEVVSLGVLVLFAYTGDTENLERYAAFNKQMGLPVTLGAGRAFRGRYPCSVQVRTRHQRVEDRATRALHRQEVRRFHQGRQRLTATRSSPNQPKLPQRGQAPFWQFFIAVTCSSRTRLPGSRGSRGAGADQRRHRYPL